jgi:hypothetical protein
MRFTPTLLTSESNFGQNIQDAANEIRSTPAVFERVQARGPQSQKGLPVSVIGPQPACGVSERVAIQACMHTGMHAYMHT